MKHDICIINKNFKDEYELLSSIPYPPSPFPSKFVFDAEFPGNNSSSTLEAKYNCLEEDLECIHIGIYNWIFAIHMKRFPPLSCASTRKKLRRTLALNMKELIVAKILY